MVDKHLTLILPSHETKFIEYLPIEEELEKYELDDFNIWMMELLLKIKFLNICIFFCRGDYWGTSLRDDGYVRFPIHYLPSGTKWIFE